MILTNSLTFGCMFFIYYYSLDCLFKLLFNLFAYLQLIKLVNQSAFSSICFFMIKCFPLPLDLDLMLNSIENHNLSMSREICHKHFTNQFVEFVKLHKVGWNLWWNGTVAICQVEVKWNEYVKKIAISIQFK